MFENNLLSTITRYGFESGSTSYQFLTTSYARRMRNNAFYSVTLGNQDANFPAGVSEISLTEDPFMDFANLDLRLNGAAGGGALCRGAGVPGALLGLGASVLGAKDVGALQANSGGTGHETMIDLWREFTGEFSTTRVPNTVVDKYLQRGLEEFNRLTGYNYSDETIALVASTQEYDLVDDFVRIAWVEHNGKELKKADLDELRGRGIAWRNTAATTPTEYFLYGNKLVLWPKPDAAAVTASSTLTVRYIRSPRDIATFGPEGLAREDYVAAVMWAVALWSAAHPDSATAIHRMGSFEKMFMQDGAVGSDRYLDRRLEPGAAREGRGARR
jgi:hypothetical protein